jgi:spermidine synthase
MNESNSDLTNDQASVEGYGTESYSPSPAYGDNPIEQGLFHLRVRRNVLLTALFCTAFSSLVYELVWSRKLSYIFGSTALAASSVLAVFMGGLALGSLCGGRILESRKRPFMFLAQLQFAIGISCILTLFVIKWVYGLQTYLFATGNEQVTYGINIMLFVLTSCVLVVPTFLIGVAFPCIVQLYHRSHDLVGQSVSRCYWIDTLGASLGMLIAAFVMVPAIGFFRTSLVASALNFISGIILFFSFCKAGIHRRQSAEPALPTRELQQQLDIKIISFLFFLSGFAALVLEVTWIRHWELIYGSGLHAFAIVVVTFLLGLSLGSLFYNRLLKRIQNQVLLFSIIELSLGAAAVTVTTLFPYMEDVFLKLYYAMENYYSFIVVLSLLCFAILVFPTILMGMTLPTLCAVKVSEYHVGRDFGRLYAVNSLGALAGSFCAGFTVIPALGIYHSSLLAGGIYVFIAFAFLYCFSESRFPRRRTATIFIGILVLTSVAFAKLRKPNHIYTGVFDTGQTYVKPDQKILERQQRAFKSLRFLKNGTYGLVTVDGPSHNLTLRNNGRVESSTSSGITAYQSLLGHIAMVVHEKASNVLNIGLGAGWTVWAVIKHPFVESIDSVEINPHMVEACKSVFHPYNGDVLNHPKVHTIINDGRNYIAHTKKRYDVIISEPSDLSAGGISALFTKEFYAHVRSALKEGGILCQSVLAYEIVEADHKIILNTIKSVFPYIYEFDMSAITHDEYFKTFLIVASSAPIDVNERLKQRKVQREGEVQKYHSYLVPLIDIIQRSFSRDNKDLEAYIGSTNEFHTDDLPIVEFHVSRDRFRRFRKK